MKVKKLLKRKEKPEKEVQEEDDPGEWWRKGEPDYVPPKPPKKSLLKSFSQSFGSMKTKRSPRPIPRPTLLGFKRVLSLVLIFMYSLVVVTVLNTAPITLLILLPTIWILLDYVRQTGRRKEEE